MEYAHKNGEHVDLQNNDLVLKRLATDNKGGDIYLPYSILYFEELSADRVTGAAKIHSLIT